MPERIALDEVAALLRPGMTVFVEGASGEPTPVLQALARAPAASAGVHYVGCRIPGLNVIDAASFHPEARLTSFFLFGAIALPGALSPSRLRGRDRTAAPHRAGRRALGRGAKDRPPRREPRR